MFVRPDGTPFVFSMMRTCFFDELKPLIEENGGVLVPYDDAILSCDQAMTLTTEADTMTENIDNRLLFHFSFVTDSCEAKTLKDPLYYRLACVSLVFKTNHDLSFLLTEMANCGSVSLTKSTSQ